MDVPSTSDDIVVITVAEQDDSKGSTVYMDFGTVETAADGGLSRFGCRHQIFIGFGVLKNHSLYSFHKILLENTV